MVERSIPVQIVAFTRSHIVNGEISLHDQRLSDYLNDRRMTLLQLKYASIERLSEPGRVIATFYSSILPKRSILFAFTPPQKEVAPVRRFIGVVKEKHEVLVAIEGAEIRGIVHTSGPLDAQQLLTSLTEGFLPITQATVTFASNPKLTFKQETILVNVPEIRFIGELLSSSPTQPRKPITPPSL